MTIDPMMFWNIILSIVVLPFGWAFNKMFSEIKRLQILLNKTREEYANKQDLYQQKQDLSGDIKQLVNHMQRIEEKLDRVIEKQNG